MEDLNITVKEGTESLEVLQGKALTQREPLNVEIRGTINAVSTWLEKRKSEIIEKQSHVLINRELMTIQLVTDESSYYKTFIGGSLTFHPDFLLFGINEGRYLHPIEMSELIKMNRGCFDNRAEAMELVSLLRNFRANVEKKVEKEINLNKGDRRVLMAQTVDSNIPKSFKLKIPIFKGQPKVEFECETYFNPDDMTCTLISPEAQEHIQGIKDEVIDKEIAKIEESCNDLVIIEA